MVANRGQHAQRSTQWHEESEITPLSLSDHLPATKKETASVTPAPTAELHCLHSYTDLHHPQSHPLSLNFYRLQKCVEGPPVT